MSELARAEFDNARIQQTTQNDARRIRQRVEAAQQGPARSGVRWPFELVQNAHDAGPRKDDVLVEINFTLDETSLNVSHTGKPFVAQELAALLSGGSSKEFDSEETTGRFGTGFLVTHALSTRVDVDGVLTTKKGPEYFHIELVRDGDEDSIVANIELANMALENAKSISVEELDQNPTASFTYHDVNGEVAERGLDRLEQALPYLYATCSKLGRVRIERYGETICFEPKETIESDHDHFIVSSTDVDIGKPDEVNSVTAMRIGPRGGRSALLIVLKARDTNAYQVLLPEEGFSRVFVTFPIAGTDFLPFNIVLDGDFAPLQERDGIAMHGADRDLIDDALSAMPTLVRHAVKSGWIDAHKLAYISVPTRPLSGENESGELEWWQDAIFDVAKQTASMPIVQTKSGFLAALHGPEVQAASFLVPAIDADATKSTDYDSVHEIAAAITGLNIPDKEIAQDWGEIARLWDDIGVPVERLGLAELSVWLKAKADSVHNLPGR